jgi:hypothetical protein
MPEGEAVQVRSGRTRSWLARANYAPRALAWRVGRFVRQRIRPPDYVTLLLEGEYPDLRPPRRDFIRRRLMRHELSLEELGDRFRAISEDDRIRGVVLQLRPLRLSFAQIETLRGMIRELREAGKDVIAWSTSYDRAGYYVACAANRIAIQPGASPRTRRPRIC